MSTATFTANKITALLTKDGYMVSIIALNILISACCSAGDFSFSFGRRASKPFGISEYLSSLFGCSLLRGTFRDSTIAVRVDALADF